MSRLTETLHSCPRCKGKGLVPAEEGMEGEIMSCPDCEGTGEGPLCACLNPLVTEAEQRDGICRECL